MGFRTYERSKKINTKLTLSEKYIFVPLLLPLFGIAVSTAVVKTSYQIAYKFVLRKINRLKVGQYYRVEHDIDIFEDLNSTYVVYDSGMKKDIEVPVYKRYHLPRGSMFLFLRRLPTKKNDALHDKVEILYQGKKFIIGTRSTERYEKKRTAEEIVKKIETE